MGGEYGLDRLFLVRFWLLHKLVLGTSNAAVVLNVFYLFTLIVLSGVEQVLAYRVGMMSGSFYEILSEINLEKFQWRLLKALGLVTAMTIVKSVRVFTSKTLGVAMRSALLDRLHTLYFARFNVYCVNNVSKMDERLSIDNSDQRLTSDTRGWSDVYISLITELCIVPFVSLYYVYAVYIRTSFSGPIIMLLLFVVSSTLNKHLMMPIVALNVKCESSEGDLRFKHASLRLQNESLVFQTPVALNERHKCQNLASKLFSIYQQLFSKQLLLDLATSAFDYLGVIVSFLVVAIPIFSGHYDHLSVAQRARIVSENAFVCIYLVYQLSKIVDMSPTLTNFAALTHRVGELVQALLQHRKDTQGKNRHHQRQPVLEEGERVDFNKTANVLLRAHNLSVILPQLSLASSNLPLIRDLTVIVEKGSNLLIMGASSSGKTSLLRVFRGLWPPQGPSSEVHVEAKAFFLPQKPFLTTGSLREQIVYPLQVCRDLEMTRDQSSWMESMLKRFKLDKVFTRCNHNLNFHPDFDWIQTLSAGELQRLAFIRLFFHRPQIAFLDEATSALDTDIEAELYRMCCQLGITVVSVGHRESLKQFHHQILMLKGDGAWTLSDIQARESQLQSH